MKTKIIIIISSILIIFGAVLQLIHFWGELGLILTLSGLTLGFIETVWGIRNKIEPQTSFSVTTKILMLVSISMIIIGAILKITHTCEGGYDYVFLGGFILTGFANLSYVFKFGK